MTAQIPDKYKYMRKNYSIVAMSDPIGFDPADYGLEPHMSSTACWRGYWCEYHIKNGKLILEKLLMYNSDNNYPDLNGIQVSPQKYKKSRCISSDDTDNKVRTEMIPVNFGHRTYLVNMEMNYTGKIVLGAEFMKKYYVHMGFQYPWAYKELKEFDFEDGALVKIIDHSDVAEMIRKKVDEDPDVFKEMMDDLDPDFISRSFSLDTDIKAWWL